MTPFDVKNIIDQKTKKEWDQELEKSYIPFMINRAYSMNMQTVLFANEMNISPFIDKRMQFDFYYHALPKAKRFDKWIKSDQLDAKVQLVSEYYQINKMRAMEFLKILSEKQLDIIKERMHKGGKL